MFGGYYTNEAEIIEELNNPDLVIDRRLVLLVERVLNAENALPSTIWLLRFTLPFAFVLELVLGYRQARVRLG